MRIIRDIQEQKENSEEHKDNNQRPIISACLIVRNEEKMIENCLKSLKDFDEIIVVDTGSIDRTIKIAKKYTNKIYNFKWNDDFSEARNFSISKATGDWILYIDADERFMSKGMDLKEFLLAQPENVLGIEIPIISELDTGIIKHELVKIFRKGIKFSGIIHENVLRDIESKNGEIVSTDKFYIMHFGYKESSRKEKDKDIRNFKLLKKAVEKEPDNQTYWYYILQGAMVGKYDFGEGKNTIETCFEIGDRILKSDVKTNLKVEVIKLFLGYFIENNKLEEMPKYLGMLYSLDKTVWNKYSGIYSYYKKDWENVYKHFSEMDLSKLYSYDLGGMFIHACLNSNHYREGVEAIDKITQKSPLSYSYSAMCAYRLGNKQLSRTLANKALDYYPLHTIATSLINLIDEESFVDKPYKILIASPVRQQYKILKEVLDSWKQIDKGKNEISYYFVDNNDDPRCSKLLEEFELDKHIDRIEPRMIYFKTSIHYWNYELVQEVAKMRNMILKYALDNNFDYVFMVDSDLVLDKNVLNVLLKTNKPVISPVFFTKGPDNTEWAQVWLQDQISLYHSLTNPELNEETKDKYAKTFYSILKTADTPIRVGGLGACTLIRRDVIEKGANYNEIYNVSFFGEDRDFCIRTVALGFDLWTYPGPNIYVTHRYRED